MFLYNWKGLNFHHPLFHYCPVGREKSTSIFLCDVCGVLLMLMSCELLLL